ncbi:hypothetical protein DPM19_21970 [Actinomadura craniellae]|uniref:Uncharacterized protein n=1 Tax=Actinomadura craniellae TaxID=2231787 RepID=A0A365H289_9ACTN|nr:hypothetical protein DPM19_21970 [Actinomadura craniellae]
MHDQDQSQEERELCLPGALCWLGARSSRLSRRPVCLARFARESRRLRRAVFPRRGEDRSFLTIFTAPQSRRRGRRSLFASLRIGTRLVLGFVIRMRGRWWGGEGIPVLLRVGVLVRLAGHRLRSPGWSAGTVGKAGKMGRVGLVITPGQDMRDMSCYAAKSGGCAVEDPLDHRAGAAGVPPVVLQ